MERENSTLIGNYYPFFTTNNSLGDSGYIYLVCSPSYNKKTLKPYLTIAKVTEKTDRKGESEETEIIYATFPEEFKDGLKNDKGVVEKKKINWEEQVRRLIGIPTVKVVSPDAQGKFPMIELNPSDNSAQINLITNLRNNLRWKTQRIAKGHKIDILWTKTQFAVFEIDGDNDNFWLKPVGLYKNNDVALVHNLLSGELPGFNAEKYSRKIGVFLNSIKQLEVKSFERDTIERES